LNDHIVNQEPNSSEDTIAARKQGYLRLVKFDSSPIMLEGISRARVDEGQAALNLFFYPEIVYWLYNDTGIPSGYLNMMDIVEIVDAYHQKKSQCFNMPQARFSDPPRWYHYLERHAPSSTYD